MKFLTTLVLCHLHGPSELETKVSPRLNKTKIGFNWAGAVNMSSESNDGSWKAEKRRVLFVDDEKNFVFSFEDILESRGYRLEDEKMHLEARLPQT